MATDHTARSVTALWRFPVKSMGGEQLSEVEVSDKGLLGDRAFALIDTATGRVVSAKSVRQFPGILDCRAAYVLAPRAGSDLPPVRVTLPDGTTVTSDASECDRVLSALFGRAVTLARAAPRDFTVDQYHPNIENADPAGRRDTVVAQPLGSAFFEQAGLPSPVPVGAFFDLFPVSVLSTSTLARLSELEPGSQFDPRRFRMNIIVRTGEAGFPENDWVGHQLALGGALRLRVALLDPRCVMTTLAQGGLPGDPEILRALVRHNRLQVGAAGLYPCAGVYAVTAAGGVVRTGDRVVVE